MSNANYRDTFYPFFPSLFQQQEGELYVYVLELSRDLLAEKAVQASKFHMPGLGDPSQLPYLAFDRALVQGPAESPASFAVRLSNAIQHWKLSGNRLMAMNDVQAYLQNLQPGASPTQPLIAIVSSAPAQAATASNTFAYAAQSQWDILRQGDAIGATPFKSFAAPFNWDGVTKFWRAWFIIYPSLVPTGLSGSGAFLVGLQPGSFAVPGHNVSGVWVPATSGTPANSPFVSITLSGVTAANIGQWVTTAGFNGASNNGTFPIVAMSGLNAVIANPNQVPEVGSASWVVSAYPFMGPAGVWGVAGATLGQGEVQVPAADTGSNVGGTWQPTPATGASPTLSWGLQTSADTMASIRGILKSRKSSQAWYSEIIVAFDGGNGVAGSAYSPLSAAGTGNPDGTFGGPGRNVAGVWVPARSISSQYDCYASGTATHVACSVLNVN